MPTALHEGATRTSLVDIFVDGNLQSNWTSSGTTSAFEDVEVGVVGREIELRSSEGLSIYEVRENVTLDWDLFRLVSPTVGLRMCNFAIHKSATKPIDKGFDYGKALNKLNLPPAPQVEILVDDDGLTEFEAGTTTTVMTTTVFYDPNLGSFGCRPDECTAALTRVSLLAYPRGIRLQQTGVWQCMRAFYASDDVIVQSILLSGEIQPDCSLSTGDSCSLVLVRLLSFEMQQSVSLHHLRKR